MIWWLVGLATVGLLNWAGLSLLGPRLARATLVLLGVYGLTMWLAHGMAYRKIESATRLLPPERPASNIAALPTQAGPIQWNALFETMDDIYYGETAIDEPAPPIERFSRYPRGFNDSRVVTASETADGRRMLRFARYPFAVVEGGKEDWRVIIRDARYERRSRSGFAVVTIHLRRVAALIRASPLAVNRRRLSAATCAVLTPIPVATILARLKRW